MCSRQWDCQYCGNHPLSEAAAASIDELGYGRDRGKINYETHWLDGPTMELALLADNR